MTKCSRISRIENNKNMDKMVDLGKSYDGPKAIPVKESKKSYPTLYVSDVGELDLPSGEFMICGKAKVVSRTETERDGKETCSYEIEIRSFGSCEDGGDGLDGAMKKIAKKKVEEDDED